MKKLIILCTVALTALLLAALVVGCQQQPQSVEEPQPVADDTFSITSKLSLGFQETTMEEASEILGVIVPMPTYLPKGLEIKEVDISYSPEFACTILLFISDEEIIKELVTKTTSQGRVQYYIVQSKMCMRIEYSHGMLIPGGFKLPGENVRVSGLPGKILESGTLWWQPPPFDIHLSRSEDISKEELFKVAESVSTPVFPLEIQVTLDKSTYLLGEDVRIEFSLKNVGPLSLEVEPFPPAVEIRHREPHDEPPKTVRSILAEAVAISIEPGETVRHTLIWQQYDDQGQPVPYGYYYLTLEDVCFGKEKVSILELRRQKLELVILPLEGVIEKTIEVNETQTVNDVTITLERVELSTSSVTFYAVCVPPDYTPPDNPLLLPLHLVKPAWAEYRLDDSAVKDAGKSGGLHLKDGIRYTWGKLDPVPNGTKELTFSITQVGRWDGPWEFHVTLE